MSSSSFNKDTNSPLVIGALGGSGTRVIAQIAIDCGYYMGDDLNHANDNLIFTRLFKSPKWFANATIEDIDKRFQLLTKYMSGNAFSLSEVFYFIKAARANETFGSSNRSLWKFFRKAMNPSATQRQRIWGWKEPNSQIFLEDINRNFPEVKYVHVFRHGLDMAFSDNVQQLMNWGSDFGIDVRDNKKTVPYYQLEYWIRSSRKTMETTTKLLGDRFFLLNYDEMCYHPERVIPDLVKFIGASPDEQKMKEFISLPKVTNSIGKYKDKDLTLFDPDQLKALKEFGFSI